MSVTTIKSWSAIELPGAPTADNQAATKQYVDSATPSGLGTAAYKDVGVSEGNVPELGTGGKLAASTLPALAITEVFTVASQSAMLALDAERGDVCRRTDVSKTFILASDDPSVLSDWLEVLIPDDRVASVNGRIGVVTVAEVGVYKTSVTADGTSSTFTVTHNLGDDSCSVFVFLHADRSPVLVAYTSAENTVTLTFDSAPDAGTVYDVVVRR